MKSSYTRTVSLQPILLNDVIFRKADGVLIFYICGLSTSDYIVYFDCTAGKFTYLDALSTYKIISLEQVFEMVKDQHVKTEMLFHLDELRRL